MPGTGHLLMPSGPCAWDVRWGFCWCSTNTRTLSQKFHVQKSEVFSPVTYVWKYSICCRWSLTSVSWHNFLPWKFNWNNKASFLFERSRKEENTKGTKQVLPHVLLAVIYNYKYKGFCAVCLSKNLNFLFNIQYTQYIDRKVNNYFQIDSTPWDKTWCIVYT